MTEEEREEILQELGKVCVKLSKRGPSGDGDGRVSLCVCVQLEEEISTLRQVLSSKEKQHADLKQKLGINPLSEFRSNFSRGWRDMQTSVAWVYTDRRKCLCVCEGENKLPVLFSVNMDDLWKNMCSGISHEMAALADK